MARIIALDTETQEGKAILITKPDSFIEPRSWDDCVEFIRTDRELAAFNMDYDAQALMKWLPRHVRNQIAMLGSTVFGLYTFRYIPSKFFKVWYDDKLLFTLYDMRQFYNCSLKRAAEKLGVRQKGDIPKSWYTKMKEVLTDPRTRATVLDYALGDARTLQAIIDKTVRAFKAAGIEFKKPYSNAVFAERYFHTKFRYTRNMAAEVCAEKAYHGGMIECLQAGYFPKAYYYDIHSAYPSAIVDLVKPDGEWIKEDYVRDDAVYCFADCDIVIPEDVHKGPIPVRRRSGVIVYPVGRFRKWITLTEYRVLAARGWVKKVRKAWNHVWPKQNYPFREIGDLYDLRRKNPDQEYALKIVMNSTYGKMAQVIEQMVRTRVVDFRAEIFDDRVWRKKTVWKEHTSFVYAAEITARIRMKVFQEVDHSKVIFYATDAVMTTEPVNLDCGSGLGQWSEAETVTDLVVVGSGVYSYDYLDKDSKQKTTVKFRGFAKDMDLRALLHRSGNRHHLPMYVTRNTSLRQAAIRAPEHAKEMNVLRRTRRFLDVNFDTKRAWPRQWSGRDLLTQSFQSEALILYGKVKLSR